MICFIDKNGYLVLQYSFFQTDLLYEPNGHLALHTEDSDFVNEH